VTDTSERLSLDDVALRASRILDEVERAVIDKRPALELALGALPADGHVLIEDYPGLAKTLVARSFAAVTGVRFSRVQFTPDLMPSDVTGSSIFNQRTGEFEFRRGPVFTNVLLADEINRAPPKTQAALLEAMQGRQVTTDEHLATNPGFREKFDASPGLCFAHFELVWNLAQTTEERELVGRVQLNAATRLLADLREHVRKHDRKYRHEPKGAEGDSWRRAISMTAGWPASGESAAEPGTRR
jgi:ATPase family associated with various cellular activities (AAA)/Family of unknown function (DUF6062)